jgi:hypothetical protein
MIAIASCVAVLKNRLVVRKRLDVNETCAVFAVRLSSRLGA